MKTILFFTFIFTLISVSSQHSTENSVPDLSTDVYATWSEYFPDYDISFEVLSDEKLLVTIPNLKTISEENHQKYFDRLKMNFTEINEISFNKPNNQFEILLNSSDLTFDKTAAILLQFGIKKAI
jgi:hypothetical protein